MMTPIEMIEVIKAYENGETIEIYDGRTWIKCNPPLWNFSTFNYRVKQKETTVYQFLLRNKHDNTISNTPRFYPDLETAQKDYATLLNFVVIKRLDYTKTIIKE